MAGILDNKSRIMDVLVTEIGRRQMAAGKMRVEFASFTDSTTFYRPDIASGSADATQRIYFEATGQYQDTITFETDDSGNLLGYEVDSHTSLIGDSIFDKSSTGENLADYLFTSGSNDFASLSDGIVSSSADHFDDLYSIGSRTSRELDKKLKLSTEQLSFTIDNSRPMAADDIVDTDIDTIEPFFLDKRLSHLDQFKFLPPVVLGTGPVETRRLGSYENLNQADEMSYFDLMLELEGSETSTIDLNSAISDSANETEGSISGLQNMQNLIQQSDMANFSTITTEALPRERKDIVFEEFSDSNNIIIQVFEVAESKFTKLDVIDFGEFNITRTPFPGFKSNKHVFFIGKVFLNTARVPTFVNVFTMVID
tara:strand:- start:2812 stop:3918 length:1107 start_codon:yes stop_codon:yes gene_type:complete